MTSPHNDNYKPENGDSNFGTDNNSSGSENQNSYDQRAVSSGYGRGGELSYDQNWQGYGQNQQGFNQQNWQGYGQNQQGFGQFPNNGYANTQPQYGAGSKPESYLIWTILATVLCCLPLGAVGIYFSTQVDSRWGRGDVQGAVDASLKAKNLTLGSIIAAVVGIIFYIFLIALGVAGSI